MAYSDSEVSIVHRASVATARLPSSRLNTTHAVPRAEPHVGSVNSVTTSAGQRATNP